MGLRLKTVPPATRSYAGGDVIDVYTRADASVSILLADISSKGALAGDQCRRPLGDRTRSSQLA
jgi:hypothetical protein